VTREFKCMLKTRTSKQSQGLHTIIVHTVFKA